MGVYYDESGRWIEAIIDSGACLSSREIRDLLRVLDVQMVRENMSCLNSGIEMLWILRFSRDKEGLIGLGKESEKMSTKWSEKSGPIEWSVINCDDLHCMSRSIMLPRSWVGVTVRSYMVA